MFQLTFRGVMAFATAWLCVSGGVRAEAPAGAEYHFKVPGHGDLVMNIPAGWQKSVQQGPMKNLPPTLTLKPGAEAMEMLMTPLWSPNGDASFNSPEKIRQAAETAGAQVAEGSKEKKITLQDLKGDKANGCYYTLTDKEPAPGSYEYMTSAVVGVGDLMVTATILHHRKDLPAREQGLALLRGLKQDTAAGAPAAAEAGGALHLKSPDGKWELVIPGNFAKAEEEASAHHTSTRLIATDEQSGITLSAYIEPAAQLGKAAMARAFYQKREQKNPMPRENIKMREVGDKAIVEYMSGKMEGIDLKQKNMNIYMVHNNTWIDVHISKVDYSDKDSAAFEAILNGVTIEPGDKPK